MPADEKPYRVYRGGRTRAKAPGLPKPGQASPTAKGGFRYNGAPPQPDKQRRPRWGRRVGIVLLALLLLIVVWAVASFLALRGGVEKANKPLGRGVRATLNRQDGSLLSQPTNILLLATDHAQTLERQADRHSDSIMIVRTDPGRHRLTYLSILRDLRVTIPGQGESKINAAYQLGGPRLAARTIRNFTGLPINHIVLVEFSNFRDVIDALGGVTVDVPAPILSNPFDCPYTETRCRSWKGWRFAEGRQHMDGRRALVYSRIRENQLQNESDATRIARQQQVLGAMTGKLTSIGTLTRLPFIGGRLLRPVVTDLSTDDFLKLGWVKFRARQTLHCRLGGTPFGSSLLPDEESRATIQMVLGRTAPQPPLPGSPYGSGCVTGDRLLNSK